MLEIGKRYNPIMPLPDFNTDGDLPIGMYLASLDEVIDRFGKSTSQRAKIAERLKRIHSLVKNTNGLARFIILARASFGCGDLPRWVARPRQLNIGRSSVMARKEVSWR